MRKRLLIGLLSAGLALTLAVPGTVMAKDKDKVKPNLVSGLFTTTPGTPLAELSAKTDKNGGRGWYKWQSFFGHEYKEAFDCVNVVGDTAVMSGQIAWSSVPSQIGADIAVVVRDGASSGAQDRFVRLQYFGLTCVDDYDELVVRLESLGVPIFEGDLSVRDR